MQELRFHGRGGQGAVTAVELIAQAAIASDLYAQGFPNFGAERRGAPVMAFLRIADSQIFLRERIDEPDVVVILDSSLLGLPEVTDGLAPGKTVIINANGQKNGGFDEITRRYRVLTVDASRIAMDTIGLPITNTAIIGAVVKGTGMIDIDALVEPFEKRFGKLAEKNIEAMRQAYTAATFINDMRPVAAKGNGNDLDYQDYLKGEALHPWSQVEIGCDVHRPGSSVEFLTGNWRTGTYPLLEKEKCIDCGICWIMCPEIAFSKDENLGYNWQSSYCKGCGICVTACPKKALSMEVEK